jgi:hypothetical protein
MGERLKEKVDKKQYQSAFSNDTDKKYAASTCRITSGTQSNRQLPNKCVCLSRCTSAEKERISVLERAMI